MVLVVLSACSHPVGVEPTPVGVEPTPVGVEPTPVAAAQTLPGPVDGFALVDGKPLVVAGGTATYDGQPVGGGGAKLAARAGGRTWVATADSELRQWNLAGAPLGTLQEPLGMGADARGGVAWGYDNSGPSGVTWGLAQAVGPTAWTRVVPGHHYAMFAAGRLTDELVVLAGSSDDAKGRRFANWLVGLDRATGEVRWERYTFAGEWSFPVALLPKGDGFLVVGHAADRQPANVVSGQPYTLAVGRDGTVGQPVFLDTDWLLQLEDAAFGADGRLWLVGTVVSTEGTVRDGPWLGAVGRVDGDRVEWRAVPGCRPATRIAADARGLWLAGHDGTFATGFVETWPYAAFAQWADVTTCPGG